MGLRCKNDYCKGDLFDELPCPVFVVQLDFPHKILEFNKKAIEVYGWSNKELLTKNVLNLVSEDQTSKLMDQINKTKFEGKSDEQEYLSNNKYKDINNVCKKFKKIVFNSRKCLLLTIHNIDSVIKKRQKFKKQQKLFDLIVKHTTDVIWQIGLSFDWKFISDGIFHHRGYTPEEAMKIPFEKGMTTESYNRCVAVMTKAMESEKYSRQILHIQVYHKDGSIKDIEVMAVMLRDSDGKPESIIGISRDITERNILKQKLADNQKYKRGWDTIHNTINKVNNYLTTIAGNMYVLPNHFKNKNKQAHDHCIEVIQNHIFKISADFNEYLKDPVCLTTMRESTNDIIEFIKDFTPANITINFTNNITSDIMSFENQLIKQILSELCLNSTKAMNKGGGVIDITIKNTSITKNIINFKAGEYLIIHVNDNGCGIKKEDMGQLMNPYYTEEDEMRGLGLFSINQLLKNNGGAMDINSVYGEGTKVKIILSLNNDNIEEKQDNIIEEKVMVKLKDGKKPIIVIIDDEVSIANNNKKMLDKKGYEGRTFSDITKFLKELKNNPYKFDLIITDYDMPDMNGVELIRQIKDLNPKLPVIISSGHLLLPDNMADSELHKPFTNDEMVEMINQLL